MLIGSFDFRVSREFWGIEDLDTALYVHAVLGGPLGYKDLLAGGIPQDMADFEEWLFAGILDPSHALFREADFLLAEDPKLADRAMYQSMVAAIATGASTRNGLATALGRQKTDLEHQSRQLEQSQMVIRDTNLLHANRPLLLIADPLLRFHHAITRPDLARFENRRTADAGSRTAFRIAGAYVDVDIRICFDRGGPSPAGWLRKVDCPTSTDR